MQRRIPPGRAFSCSAPTLALILAALQHHRQLRGLLALLRLKPPAVRGQALAGCLTVLGASWPEMRRNPGVCPTGQAARSWCPHGEAPVLPATQAIPETVLYHEVLLHEGFTRSAPPR